MHLITGWWFLILSFSFFWPTEAGTYRERLPLERLQDEVADDPAVIHVHARPKGVEDSCHSHFYAFLERQRRK